MTDQAAFLPMWTGVPQKQTRATHWTKSSLLPGYQAVNQHGEYLSIYSKDYLQSYHTHIPVSSFGTKKMQRKRVLTVYVYSGRRHQKPRLHVLTRVANFYLTHPFLDLVSGRSSNWHSMHARVGGVQPLNLETNLEMALFGVSNVERRF